MNPHVAQKNYVKPKVGFLQTAFPVPRSLILANVAIDVSDEKLKFYEVHHSRGKKVSKAYGISTFPHIDLGSLTDKSKTEAVTALSAWSNAQKCKHVRLVIHEDEAYVFKVTLPTTNTRDIRGAIEAVLEENVPIPPIEAVFEYDIISQDETNQTSTVAVSVISKKSAGNLIEIFNQSGIQVVSLETEARALAKALLPVRDDGVHAVIAVMEHHTLVFIVEKGAVVFSSALEVGSVDLDQAIAKEFAITETAARELKNEKAFVESDGDMQLFEAMVPIFSIIQDELDRMLVYWRTQSKKNKDAKDVSNIILSGSDALIAGFARYIGINSKLPAKPGSVWTNILSIEDSVPDIFLRDSYEYGTVIGTLL